MRIKPFSGSLVLHTLYSAYRMVNLSAMKEDRPISGVHYTVIVSL